MLMLIIEVATASGDHIESFDIDHEDPRQRKVFDDYCLDAFRKGYVLTISGVQDMYEDET